MIIKSLVLKYFFVQCGVGESTYLISLICIVKGWRKVIACSKENLFILFLSFLPLLFLSFFLLSFLPFFLFPILNLVLESIFIIPNWVNISLWEICLVVEKEICSIFLDLVGSFSSSRLLYPVTGEYLEQNEVQHSLSVSGLEFHSLFLYKIIKCCLGQGDVCIFFLQGYIGNRMSWPAPGRLFCLYSYLALAHISVCFSVGHFE